MSFEVVGRVVAERGMPPFGVAVGDGVADFEPGFGPAGEAAEVEQFGFGSGSQTIWAELSSEASPVAWPGWDVSYDTSL